MSRLQAVTASMRQSPEYKGEGELKLKINILQRWIRGIKDALDKDAEGDALLDLLGDKEEREL